MARKLPCVRRSVTLCVSGGWGARLRAMCELHVYSRVVFELHVYSICFQSLSVRVCVCMCFCGLRSIPSQLDVVGDFSPFIHYVCVSLLPHPIGSLLCSLGVWGS